MRKLLALVLLAVGAFTVRAQETGIPDPAGVRLIEVVGGFNRPVLVTHAGDASGRLFIVEQYGRIWIYTGGALLPQPFLDVADRLSTRGNEQGLLGLAFHPNYETNGLFFVNYTDRDGATAVVRYRVSADDPNRADPASAETILQIAQPFGNHNGGHIAFGPDGYLYIGMGDGGSAGDPQGSGQNPTALLGKMLRIDVNAEPYAIPSDNPFVNAAGFAPEIWALGLRNPWRFSFDRAAGDLYIADVGQNAIEEVNFQPAGSSGGENYGWNFLEGTRVYSRAAAPAGLTAPFFEYPHSEGCSVTGGYVYRGERLPDLQGTYLFGDYCSGMVYASRRDGAGIWRTVRWLDTNESISSFGEDEAGELYLVGHAGSIFRFEPAG
ncbi:MAG: glucose dehydrogenase [Chloroflexi bacterium]|nr:glucose dehydrogenase [Chloroflexota bacterium]MDL1883941.1 PQQ-dependent sugar dehydrogenase [Anaerolineae bacterium CFX8]